jgi:hypothetical protein
MKATRSNPRFMPRLETLERRILLSTIVPSDPLEWTVGGMWASAVRRFALFSTSDPGTTLSSTAISGLGGSEDILAMAVRPSNGQLYGLGVKGGTARVLQIDLDSGTTTQIGSTFGVTGSNFGFDFDPTTDLLRIVSDADENISFNLTTGKATSLPDLSPSSSSIVAIAFTNNFVGATSTTLFGLDTAGNVFSSINPATGVVTPIGSLATDPNGSLGFDIAPDGTAFATMNFTSGPTLLFTLNIADRGQPTLEGSFDPATPLTGLAIFGKVSGPNQRTASFTDVDGDIVTVKISKGMLDPSKLQLVPANGGFYLRALNLADPQFAGSSVTITAKPGPHGGDGFVNVGAILAGTNNLGAVSVKGDLGQIDAGAPTNTAKQPAVKSLTVQSMGMYGLSTQIGGDLVSDIKGALPKLVVKGDVRGENVAITGNLGTATIAGSLIGGSTADSGSIHAAVFGSVSIGGDLIGATATGTGAIIGTGTSVIVGGSVVGVGVDSGKIATAASVTIHGDLIGGSGTGSGLVEGTKVVIDADVRGGSAVRAGSVDIANGSLKLGGSVVGGTADQTGEIRISGVGGAKSNVIIGGSIVGGGDDSGAVSVLSGASLSKLKISGIIVGGTGANSGIVRTAPGSDIALFTVGGDVRGGPAANSGAIITGDGNPVDQGSDIGQLLIGGGFFGSTVAGSGLIFISGSLGTFTLGGSVIGWTADDTSVLETTGDIGSISIGDSIEAIGGKNAGIVKAGGAIGKVTIKHDIIGAGDSSAQLISGGAINSVTLGGSIIGGSGDFSSRIVSGGDLVSLTVGHDIRSGAGVLSGSVASSKAIGAMLVNGSLIGTAANKLRIFALESSAPTNTTNLAIGNITVNGRVEFTQIEAGYTADGTPANGDAQIGLVTIGRDWIASDLVAGATDGGNGNFGDAGDASIGVGDPGTHSKIASIAIKGQALGTVGGADHYGFVAQQIGSMKIGASTFALTPGAGNDLAGIDIGMTGDLSVLEIGI